jgi:hypothetical protein
VHTGLAQVGGLCLRGETERMSHPVCFVAANDHMGQWTQSGRGSESSIRLSIASIYSTESSVDDVTLVT